MLTSEHKKQHQLANQIPELPTANLPVARPLTIAEVAEYLAVHNHTVRRWISAGKLKAYNYGPRVVRVHPGDLEKFREQIAPSTYDHVNGGGQ